jgi:type VI secretion system protein ImpJ
MASPPQRVVWSEGMFLSPQHLQSLDRYHERLLAARLEAVAPWSWGVSDLALDLAALAGGQLKVQRFAGILPGGLCLAFEENDPGAPPPRAVAERFPATARALPVWLGVPREREGAVAAAAPEADGPRSRYLLAHRPVQDAMQPGAMATVPFGVPGACLLLGDESREDHDALPIAEIVRTAAGGLGLSETFLPPLLRIGATQRLPSVARDLLARVVARHRELAAGRRQREATAGELTGADLSRALQLVVLGGALPVLAHLADAVDASPRELYLALAALDGQLAAFSPDADAAGQPRFAHEDLRGTLEPLLARIDARLRGLGVERFTRVALEVRGLIHVARAIPDALLRGARLVLAVKSEIPEAMVAEQLPRLCKIASLGEIQGLVQAAAPGLPLQVLHRPPSEIPLRAGTIYFELGQLERFWKGVQSERALAIHLPPPFDPARTPVELLAIPRPSGE